MYAQVCEKWNVDPAAGFVDDVLAYNLRAGLAFALGRDRMKDAEPDEGTKHQQMTSDARRRSDMVRKAVGDG